MNRITLTVVTAATLMTLAAGVANAGMHTDASYWFEQEVLPNPPANAGDNFGEAAAIDGDYAMVGAPNTSFGNHAHQGAVFVYHRDGGGNWAQVAELTDGDSDGHFGDAIAIKGKFAIIGAPGDTSHVGHVYVYWRDTNGVWQPRQTLSGGVAGDDYGISVAIDTIDRGGQPHDWLVVGADNTTLDNAQGAGNVWVYQARENPITHLRTFMQEQQLVAATPTADEHFGHAVALHLLPAVAIDGSTTFLGRAMIGAPGGNYADALSLIHSVFDPPGNIDPIDFLAWRRDQTLRLVDGVDANPPADFGFSLALSQDGATAAISAPSWQSSQLGDASRVAIFTNSAGAAGIGTWQQQTMLVPADPHTGDFFGRALAFGNTKLLATAAWVDDKAFNAGAAYLFDTATWSLDAELLASDGSYAATMGASGGISAEGTVMTSASIAQTAYFFSRHDDRIFADGFEPTTP